MESWIPVLRKADAFLKIRKINNVKFKLNSPLPRPSAGSAMEVLYSEWIQVAVWTVQITFIHVYYAF